MIQEYINKNRDTIVSSAKRMMIVGWVLLIPVPVMLLSYVIQLIWASRTWSSLPFVVIQSISFVFFGFLFLVLGQFLRYELGLEKQAGWFLRNGVVILRLYAAVIIGFIIYQLAGVIFAMLKEVRFLWLGTYLLSGMLGVAKVLLLWGAASMLKMMMSGTSENTQLNV